MNRSSFERSVEVRVQHWMNRREVLIAEDKIAFQLTLSCSHCATCQSRVEQVQAIMKRSSTLHSFELINGKLYLILPLGSTEDPVKVINVVTGLGVYM